LPQIKRTGFQHGILKAHTGDTPIALYPDTLLSSTYPLEVIQAERWVTMVIFAATLAITLYAVTEMDFRGLGKISITF
jgi:hypothetical protein